MICFLKETDKKNGTEAKSDPFLMIIPVLHVVDGVEEVKEGFTAFFVISNLFSAVIGWRNDGIVVELGHHVLIEAELLGWIDVKFIKNRCEVAKGSLFNFADILGWS